MTRRDFLQTIPITFVLGGVGDYGETFEVFVGDYVRHKQNFWNFFITDAMNHNGERILLAEVLDGRNHYGQVTFQKGSFINIVGTLKANEWEKYDG